MSKQKVNSWATCTILCFVILSSIISSCAESTIPDLSTLQITPPATRTPVPTPTEITPYPTYAEATRKAQANSSSTVQAIDLIAQLNRIYERLTGNPEFDLNSEILSKLDAPIQEAIAKLKAVSANSGSDSEAAAAYAEAIAELERVAKVGTANTVLVNLEDAGNSMSSDVTEQLAAALNAGDIIDISAEIDNLAEVITELPPEKISEVATDLLSAANELTDATGLIDELIPEGTAEVGGNIGQKLAQAAAALETNQTESFLAHLAGVKSIVDAISANLQLAQFLTISVENVEQETQALQGLTSLLGSGGNVRISNVEIKLLKTNVQQALSADMLPPLGSTNISGAVCLLGTDLNVSCLNDSAEWAIPAALAPYAGRISAITECGDQFVMATDSELVYFKDDIATPFARDNYPF